MVHGPADDGYGDNTDDGNNDDGNDHVPFHMALSHDNAYSIL